MYPFECTQKVDGVWKSCEHYPVIFWHEIIVKNWVAQEKHTNYYDISMWEFNVIS